MFASSKLLRTVLRNSLAAILTPARHGRKLHRRQRSCGPEQLEVRQLLTGDLVWAGAIGGTGTDEANAIATDAGGNTYVTGSFLGTADVDPGPAVVNLVSNNLGASYVCKLAPDGSLIWAKMTVNATAIGTSSGVSLVKPTDIAVDPSGNVLITGYFAGTADFDPGAGVFNQVANAGLRAFVQKLNSNGNLVWAKSVGGTSGVYSNGLAVDAAGGVYITGAFNQTADFDPGAGVFSLTSAGVYDAFYARLQSNGDFFFAGSMGGLSSESGDAIAVDSSGDIVLAGTFSSSADFNPDPVAAFNLGSNGTDDVFVTRLNSGGQFLWAGSFGGLGLDSVVDVALDSTGSIVLTGTFAGTTDFDPGPDVASLTSVASHDIYIARLQRNGSYDWARQIRSSIQGDSHSLAIDAAGNIYTTGVFYGFADFDPGAGTSLLTASFGAAFVSSLDSAGDHRWARQIAGTATVTGTGIAVDPEGNIHIAGNFSGTADFNPGFLQSLRTSHGGFSDGFVVKLSPDMVYAGEDVDGEVPASQQLLLRKNGVWLDLWRTMGSTTELVNRQPLNDVRGVVLNGAPLDNELLTINFGAFGGFMLPGGIRFIGGGVEGNNSVNIVGAGNEGVTYRPSATVGMAGQMIAYGQTISFTDCEASFFNNLQNLNIEPQGSADILTIGPGVSLDGSMANHVAGTTGGTTITEAHFHDVQNLTIDTGLRDALLPNDSVTLNATGLNADGLKSVFVRTGRGADSLIFQTADLGLPVSGGAFWFLGGSGSDLLQASGDVNWDLSDIRLVSSGGGRLQIDEIERASITGGVSGNHINAATFTGSVTLDGSSGHDLLRGGYGGDTLHGGVGNDRIFAGAGDDTLNGQDGNDSLWGEDGNDTLYGNNGHDFLWGGDGDDWLGGFAGNDVLLGGEGHDTLNGGDQNDRLYGDAGIDSLLGGNGTDSLWGGADDDSLLGGADNDFLDGGSGNDALNGEAGIDLYSLQGTSNSEELWLNRVSSTSAIFRRRPRGLVSSLETDTITMDASDEFHIQALEGDDALLVDALFTQLGSLDGGLGDDVSGAPAPWTKVSC